MRVKTYKAMNMEEAFRLIKQDLGPDAVILSTRKTAEGSRAFGLLGRPMVEVTAALDVSARHGEETGREAGHAEVGHGAVDPRGWDLIRDEIRGLRREMISLICASGGRQAGLHQEVEQGLDELRWWISYMTRRWERSGETGYPDDTGPPAETLCRLLRQGVRESHARDILDRLDREDGEGEGLEQRLRQFLARIALVSDPLSTSVEGPLVLALVGTTGVGKTTTVAKIAAQCALGEGRKVGMITNDTYRIAAVEQLRTYARIMGVPLEVALNPSDLPQILGQWADLDLVLMDTAGRSPFDSEHMAELSGFLSADPRVKSLMLVGANMDVQMMERSIQCFSPVKPIALIATKLDEAKSFGSLFSLSLQSRLPFAFFTTGQRVPEDIRKATREDVAAWTIWGIPPFCQQDMELSGRG